MFQLFIMFDLREFGWEGKKISLLVASCFSSFVWVWLEFGFLLILYYYNCSGLLNVNT
jgi:hypothetical protein